MKKLIVACAVVVFGSLFVVGSAGAQSSITNTGPGSNNSITNDNSTNCDVTNSTDIDISGSTNQSSSSGGASVNGNTTGGSATSGSSSNSSSNNVVISVTNGTPCVAVAPTTNPETPEVPTTGGNVLGETTSGGRGAYVAVASISALPATGETTAAYYVTGLVFIVSAVALVSRMAFPFGRELGLF